ncbi:B-box zinc finger domain-containing protein [Cryptosporidium felis]|nr:B-box zinc finger domain-containing protein [Cryptosporidium felis]
MTEERVINVIPELIDDASVLARCEYMIQLSYYTPDLHVTRAWSLITKEQRETFNKYASNLGGHVIHGFDSNPLGIYRFGIFTIALGPVLTVDGADGVRSTAPFPPGYMCRSWQDPGSMNVPSSRSSFTANYQVKFCDQILPTMLVEIEFKPLRIEISQPICEMCDVNISTLYCESDKAHLCASCDEFHHSSTRLLSKHQRVPVSQSPYQFGFCPHHSTERIDSVCMNCYISLCPHCILIGQHSSGDAAEHILISTTDAVRMAYSGVSQSDLELHRRKKQLADYLSGRHNHINDIRSNYDEIRERIEMASKSLLQQLISLRERKVSFIMSIKRQLLTELLLIEWMEAFFAHLRLALLPSDFLVYSHRHDLVCSYFFGGKSNIVVSNDVMPSWIMEKFFVDGGFNVVSRSGEAEDMLNVLKDAQLESGDAPRDPESLDSLDALKKRLECMDETGEGESPGAEQVRRLGRSAAAKWTDFDKGELANDKSVFSLDGRNLPVERKLLTSSEYDCCRLPSLGVLEQRDEASGSGARFPELRVSRLTPQMRSLVEKMNQSSRNAQEHSYSRYDVDDLVENLVACVKSRLEGASEDLGDKEAILFKIQERDQGDQIQKTVDEVLRSRSGGPAALSVWDPSVERPSELAKEYWRFLVGYDYELLIALLHSAPSVRRRALVQDVFNLSIYMQSFDHLFHSLLHFEVGFLSSIPVDTMLVSSSVINDFFHVVLKANSLTKVDRSFLVQQIQIALISVLNRPRGPYFNHLGKSLGAEPRAGGGPAVEQRELDKDLAEFEKEILESTENFVGQMTALDVKAIPDTIRGILYGVIDTIDSVSSEARLRRSGENGLNHLPSRPRRVATYCSNGSISFCSQILLNHYVIPRISSVIASINYTVRGNGAAPAVITRKADLVARIQCFRRAVSAVSIYVWEPSARNTPEKGFSALEAKYRELGLRVFSWVRNILNRPRLISPITFNIIGMPERGTDSIQNIADYMAWLDDALRNDRLKSDGGMDQKDLLKCQYFEDLLSLAIKGPS